jgi:hypothetical protein
MLLQRLLCVASCFPFALALVVAAALGLDFLAHRLAARR